jgi:hypothetical protein
VPGVRIVAASRRGRRGHGRPAAALGVGVAGPRRFIALTAALVLAGCGGYGDGGGEPDTVARSPAEAGVAVRRAATRIRSSGSVPFTSTVERVRADRPSVEETLITASGTVDVAADRGRMDVDLSPLFADAPAATAKPFDRPVALRWTRSTLEARIAGERRTLTRAAARSTGGLLGRLPDEPAALVGALGASRDVRDLGSDSVRGVDARRYVFTVRGAPGRRFAALARLVGSAAGTSVPLPSLQAWIGGDGELRRVAYVIDLPRVRGSNGDFLPRRTLTATYDLGG